MKDANAGLVSDSTALHYIK